MSYRSRIAYPYCLAGLLAAASVGPTSVTMGIDYNNLPRRMRQTEWWRPVFPTNWGTVGQTSGNNVITVLYIRQGMSSYVGQNVLNVPDDELVLYSSVTLPQPHRYAFASTP